MSKNTKSAKKTKAVKVKPAPAPVVETVKGTWQDDLATSSKLRDKSDRERKRAGALLWDGAKAGIEAWDSESDPSAERFSDEVNAVLGAGRKGDASKIKTVALAVKSNGLDLDEFPNLSKAYAEARRLTQTVKVEADEDSAADEVISALDVPKTASTAEAAAKIVLAKGVDEAARLLLDTLGDHNFDAHRALLRALTQETSGRVKAQKEAEKKAAVVDAPKPGATQASKADKKATPKAAPKGSTKAKPAPVEAPTEKAEAIEGEKAKPVVKKPVVKARPKPVVAKK